MAEKKIAPDIPSDVAEWGDSTVQAPLLGELSDDELKEIEELAKELPPSRFLAGHAADDD